MKIISNLDKVYLGHENWRIRAYCGCKLSDNVITISIENFNYGFHTGEQYDKIFMSNLRDGGWVVVSFMSKKGYDEVLSKYDEVIELFYKRIEEKEEKLIREYKEDTKRYRASMKLLHEAKNSDIFKLKKREDKLSELEI